MAKWFGAHYNQEIRFTSEVKCVVVIVTETETGWSLAIGREMSEKSEVPFKLPLLSTSSSFQTAFQSCLPRIPFFMDDKQSLTFERMLAILGDVTF